MTSSMPPLKHLVRIVPVVVLIFIVLSFGFGNGSPSLQPFGSQKGKPFWYIATMTIAKEQRRRNLIRTTWQRLYKDYPIKTVFFMNNPTDTYRALIEHENATYGDIIVLDHLVEEPGPNKTVKPAELYKKLVREGQRYNWVTKMDDDSWIDVPNFIEQYLKPHWNHNTTIIARELINSNPDDQTVWETGFNWPGGQFYAISWDFVELVAKLHEEHFVTNDHEDRLITRLLYDAKIPYNFVRLENPVAFDWGPAQGTKEGILAGEKDDLTKWVHPVGPGAINPHKMKTDQQYMKVAALYDEYGQNKPRRSGKVPAPPEEEQS